MSPKEIEALLSKELGLNPVEAVDENARPFCIILSTQNLKKVMEVFHQHPSCYFDSLSCLTALDNGPEAGTMEVIYHLYSIPHHQSLAVKCILKRNPESESLPAIPSVSYIWKTANWHEREAYEMYGIHFEGHPDLRRLLLPADWQGYPLRKDYKEQEKYHGISVKY